MKINKQINVSTLYHMVRTDNDVEKFIAQAKGATTLAVHIEPAGSNPIIDNLYTFWVATKENQPAAFFELNTMPTAARAAISELLESNSVVKIAFDWIRTTSFLVLNEFTVAERFFDIDTANRLVLAGGVPADHSLDSVISRVLSQPSGLNDALDGGTASETDSYFNNMARRVQALIPLRKKLIAEIKSKGLVDTAALEFNCIKALVHLKIDGFGVDQGQLEITRGFFNDMMNKSAHQIFNWLGREINVHSRKEFMTAFNMHPEAMAQGIVISNTDSSTLKPLVDKLPVLGSLLDYRHNKTCCDAVSKCLGAIHPQSGRIHASYDPLGAVTGRLSCSKPALQGLPKVKEIRECFVPDKGNKLVKADYSQIELRIAAEISQDEKMIEAFRSGIDFHKLTASIITGKTISEIDEQSRKAAKAVNFGMLFGMGPRGLCSYAMNSYNVELSIDEAQKFQKAFFDAYPGLAAWCRAQVKPGTTETRTLGGRVRYWGQSCPKATELLNSPIQGSAADVIKKALSELPVLLYRTGALFVACIHDEIILEVAENEAERAAEELGALMEKAGQHYLKEVPVVVDVNVADSWAS